MRSLICALPLILVSVTQGSALGKEPSQQDRPLVIRKSGGVLQDSATKKVEPVYPPLAKAARVSGSVVVEVTVDEEGNVTVARTISGHPLLKDSAREAAQEWKFKPTLLSGVPVKVIGAITFNFNLGVEPDEIEALVKEVRKNPSSSDAHYRLGSAYREWVMYEEAIDELKEAIRIKPAFVAAHSKLGDAFLKLRRYDEAADAYATAIRLDPQNLEAILGSGMVATLSSRYDDAIANFKRALELDPKAASTLFCLGITYSAMGRKEDAIARFKEGLAIRPNDDHMHHELGLIYVQMGNKQAAMEEYAILRTLNPNLAETFLKEIEK